MVQYSYDKIRTQTFSLPTGSSFLLEENLFAQELPSKIIVCHVPTESYSGSYKRNPSNAPHCDVSSIALYIDGKCIPSTGPIRLDYKNDDCLEAYLNMYSQNGIDLSDKDIYLSPNDVWWGYNYHVFSTTNALGKDCQRIKKRANIRLETYFKAPLIEGFTCMVIGVIPDTFTIDQERNVRPSA